MIEKDAVANNAIIVNTLAIILAASIAIILHAVMPAGVNTENFDSVFVKLLGFPVVAASYFVLLFTHCVVVMRYLGNQSNVPKLQIGIRFGLAFAILYFFGMQEVVVEGSPFGEWGVAFVSYQFFIGVGDAIPVLLLCGTVAYFTLDNANTCLPVQTLRRTEKIKVVIFITLAFLTERVIGYETGIITGNCNTYPIPCYIWTILFGMVLGYCYLVLYPVLVREQNKLLLSIKLLVQTIGVNWIIFNSFIGLIYNGYMSQMLLRSGIDVAILFLSCIVISNYFIKPDIRENSV
ncbi:hypothetical protein SPSYN_01242 [Sporotomaculum syntrophicum]|uniref:Uncharacterized protein n=1 Tax=Sporotomaculum syntrophicum TaxID=182264 RepID=A0A9D3AY58_9FIRM|nr:hypothetical protein [Sporotomaculum syntrophicum]KAF1085106.1 hypothetical protein SPSYN_01242 [Sporotomaculum syntrophicum]